MAKNDWGDNPVNDWGDHPVTNQSDQTPASAPKSDPYTFKDWVTGKGGLIRAGLSQARKGVSELTTPGQRTAGAADVIEGAGRAALPAALPAMAGGLVTAAIPTLTGLAGGYLGSKAASGTASILGADEDTQRLAGDIGGIAGGGAGYAASTPAGRAVTAGALKGGWQEAAEPVSVKGFTIPKSLAYAFGGGLVPIGGVEGREAGAAVGLLAPFARGAYRGGREALEDFRTTQALQAARMAGQPLPTREPSGDFASQGKIKQQALQYTPGSQDYSRSSGLPIKYNPAQPGGLAATPEATASTSVEPSGDFPNRGLLKKQLMKYTPAGEPQFQSSGRSPIRYNPAASRGSVESTSISTGRPPALTTPPTTPTGTAPPSPTTSPEPPPPSPYSAATKATADAMEKAKLARDAVTIPGLRAKGITQDVWDAMPPADKKSAIESLHPKVPGKKSYTWRNDPNRNAEISAQLGASGAASGAATGAQ